MTRRGRRKAQRGRAGQRERPSCARGATAARRRADLVSNLRRMSRRPVGSRRRVRRPRGPGSMRAPRRPATSAGSTSEPSTATCSTLTTAGSSACATDAGRCAPPTPSCGRPASGCSCSTASSCPTSSGPGSTSRSASPSSCSAAPMAGRRRCIRAPPGRPSPSSTSRPGRSSRTQTRCSKLLPDAEALIVNRISEPPQFAIVPIDECYALVGMVKANWEGISGGAAIEEVPRFFEGLRERAGRMSAGRTTSGTRSGGVPTPRPRGRQATRPGRAARSPLPRARVLDVRAAERSGADAALQRRGQRPLRPRGLHDRAHDLIQIEPSKRTYDEETRAPRRALRRAPPLVLDDAELRWTQVDVLVPVQRPHPVRDRRPLHLRPRARRDQVLPRARGRRGAAALPLQRQRLLLRRARWAPDHPRSLGTVAQFELPLEVWSR